LPLITETLHAALDQVSFLVGKLGILPIEFHISPMGK